MNFWRNSWRWLVLFALLLGLALMPFTGNARAYAGQTTQLVLIDTVDNPALPSGLRVVERYDAFVLAEAPLTQVSALQRDARVDLLPERTTISLNGVVFDTVQGEPRMDAALRAAADDPHFLIQYYGPIKKEWVANLETIGVTFLAYWPNYTYIVRMDPALVGKVQAAHAVQWVGRYHPAYRLASDEEMMHAQRDGDKLAVLVSTFEGVDAADLQVRLEAAGATLILFEANDPPVARVWASSEQLPILAALRGVFRVEPYDPPKLTNDVSTQVMHTKYLWRAGRNGLLQDLMGAYGPPEPINDWIFQKDGATIDTPSNLKAAEHLEDVRAMLKTGKTVIAYCYDVNCPLGADLVKDLRKQGVGPIKVMPEGWVGWMDRGYPYE